MFLGLILFIFSVKQVWLLNIFFYRAEIKAVCYGAHYQRYESHSYTML